MDIYASINNEEQEFPRLFAQYQTRPYGTLFYNANIKDHNDSNHAVIYPDRIIDLENVLNDITEFYLNMEIQPRLYHPPVANYFLENANTLKTCGYAFTIELDRRIMMMNNRAIKPVTSRLHIKRITQCDMQSSFIPDNDEYLYELYKNSINNENHYIFAGFYKNTPASLVSFHVSEYGCTRFDEMKTAAALQGMGFARDMNNFAVNFCIKNALPVPYQWPAHDTSERITTEAGFELAFLMPGGHAAYSKIAHYIED